jgi:ribonuclease HII
MALWAAGHRLVAGLDEAGRGAWAGPVVAAAVVLSPEPGTAERLAGVTDSKTLTPSRREKLYDVVLAEAAAVGTGIVLANRIDVIGIAPATREAMVAAIKQLPQVPDYLLIDHVRLPYLSISQRSITKGDQQILSIAAASIVAKVTRDRLMRALAVRHPGYGLERHKGYGTVHHQAALQQLGPSSIHRLSFRPVRGLQPTLQMEGVGQDEVP